MFTYLLNLILLKISSQSPLYPRKIALISNWMISTHSHHQYITIISNSSQQHCFDCHQYEDRIMFKKAAQASLHTFCSSLLNGTWMLKSNNHQFLSIIAMAVAALKDFFGSKNIFHIIHEFFATRFHVNLWTFKNRDIV